MTDIKEKLATGKNYLKNYWSEPAPNNYLSVKEKVAYGGAQIGTFIFSTVVAYMTFTPNWFCGAIVGIDYADFDNIIVEHLGEDVSKFISNMTMSKFAASSKIY